MMDSFVLLTPILILAVLALVRFVGCLSKPAPPGPMLLSAVPGDQMVILTWTSDEFHLYNGYNIKRGTQHGGPYTTVGSADESATSFTDTGLADGTAFFYIVTGKVDSSFPGDPDESGPSNELSATPEPVISVTFDSPTPTPNSGDPIGTYKNLNFSAEWIWVDTVQGGGPSNAATFTLATTPGGDIMFVNGPRVLSKIEIFAKQPANVTISDNSLANTQVAVAVPANTSFVVQTNWTLATTSFHVATDIGFDLLLDTIVYLGPA